MIDNIRISSIWKTNLTLKIEFMSSKNIDKILAMH